MRIKIFAAGLAMLIFAIAPLPGQAQYYGGWKYMLLRTLGPPLVNRGINYLMNHRSQPSYSAEPESYGYSAPPSPPRTYAPRPHRSTPVSHSVPHSTSHSSSSSSHGSHLEIPPPPKMFVPPPPPGVPTGAVLGLYPQDMNYSSDSSSKSDPPKTALASTPKTAPAPKGKPQH